MSVYTIINSSGEVHSVFTSTDATAVAQNTPSGYTAIAGYPPAEESYWSTITEAWVAKGARPSWQHLWNTTTKEWYDPRTLAEVVAAVNTEINTAWVQTSDAGFIYATKGIATDLRSMQYLSTTAILIARTGALPTGWPGGWKAKDNTYVSITTVAQWDTFYEAVYQNSLTNFNYSQTLKEDLAAATTITEALAIEWAPS